MPSPAGKPAIFLDRDGIINQLVFYPDTGEWESPRVEADFRLIPGAAAAIGAMRGAGWPVFVISNQPSFAKGKTSLAALEAVHRAMLARLDEEGAGLDGASYCYHHPQGLVPGYSGTCPCRKPSPHLVLQTAREHGLDLARSWFAGDQDSDLLCGRNAGCRTVLIPCEASRSKRGAVAADHRCTNLADLLDLAGPLRESPW